MNSSSSDGDCVVNLFIPEVRYRAVENVRMNSINWVIQAMCASDKLKISRNDKFKSGNSEINKFSKHAL